MSIQLYSAYVKAHISNHQVVGGTFIVSVRDLEKLQSHSKIEVSEIDTVDVWTVQRILRVFNLEEE